MAKLNDEERKTLENIKAKPYMVKVIDLVENFVEEYKNKDKKLAYLIVFDEIFRILNEAKKFVDAYLQERKKRNEIKDEKQALKSIAGNSFSFTLIYIFLKNKELGNIREDIFVTSQTSKVPSFKEIAIIDVDGETQKPDCDLVIYSLNNDESLKKCMIVSLKTSLRERAGQTYKWKLLMEIASSENSIKEKYNIKYNPNKMPLVIFATVNFYNEINNPQHRGMFKFFDKSFIAKNIKDMYDNFIVKMSALPQYVNENL
jgi:type II restriction enzyme